MAVPNKYAAKLAAQSRVIPGAGNFQSAAATRAIGGPTKQLARIPSLDGEQQTQQREVAQPSRSDFLSKINSPYAARQAAFQDKLSVHNDWSRSISDVLAAARRQRELTTRSQQSQPQAVRAKVAGSGAAPVASFGRGPTGWGNYRNGQIPQGAMQSLSWAPNARMRSDAASQFERLNEAFRKQFGRNIPITDSYRSLQGQIDIKRRKPGLAATPGRSNHGWGLAVDLGGGINRESTPENRWMYQNAAKFGFGRSADPRVARIEPWHWEFRG